MCSNQLVLNSVDSQCRQVHVAYSVNFLAGTDLLFSRLNVPLCLLLLCSRYPPFQHLVASPLGWVWIIIAQAIKAKDESYLARCLRSACMLHTCGRARRSEGKKGWKKASKNEQCKKAGVFAKRYR